jgi:carbon-monoxide dehydrogenase large subunit
VNDALHSLGAELLVSPITPRRVLEAIVAGAASRQESASTAQLAAGELV